MTRDALRDQMAALADKWEQEGNEALLEGESRDAVALQIIGHAKHKCTKDLRAALVSEPSTPAPDLLTEPMPLLQKFAFLHASDPEPLVKLLVDSARAVIKRCEQGASAEPSTDRLRELETLLSWFVETFGDNILVKASTPNTIRVDHARALLGETPEARCETCDGKREIMVNESVDPTDNRFDVMPCPACVPAREGKR